MTFPEHWPFYILLGVASGVLSGTLGVGAGVIMVPVLVFMAFPQKEAQALSLAVMVPMALVGVLRYHQNPEIVPDWRVAVFIALGAVGGIVAGVYFAGVLSGLALKRLFAVFMMLAAIRMFLAK